MMNGDIKYFRNKTVGLYKMRLTEKRRKQDITRKVFFLIFEFKLTSLQCTCFAHLLKKKYILTENCETSNVFLVATLRESIRICACVEQLYKKSISRIDFYKSSFDRAVQHNSNILVDSVKV